MSDAGRRCEARERVEYDHVVPVARGGEATVEGVRLLCRAHNQLEAERVYGAGFMGERREAARRATAARREAAMREQAAGREAERYREAAEPDPDTSVIPWLRELGLRADHAKRAAMAVEGMADAPIEERVKAALAAYARARYPNAHRDALGEAISP